jgi:hypothetical protein
MTVLGLRPRKSSSIVRIEPRGQAGVELSYGAPGRLQPWRQIPGMCCLSRSEDMGDRRSGLTKAQARGPEAGAAGWGWGADRGLGVQ